MNKIPVVYKGLLEDKKFWVDPGNPSWLKWLDSNKSFRYEPAATDKGFTVRKEKPGYWIGYRKISGKLHKKYIGKSEDITVEVLEQAAKELEQPPQPKDKPKASSDKNETEYATKKELNELKAEVKYLREEIQRIWRHVLNSSR